MSLFSVLQNYKGYIPSNIRSRILQVDKIDQVLTQNFNFSYSSEQMITELRTTQNYLWIPSYNEIWSSGNGNYWVNYYTLFGSNNIDRAKMRVGQSTKVDWWLRTYRFNAYNNFDYCYMIYSNGNSTYDVVTNSYSIPLCFCT